MFTSEQLVVYPAQGVGQIERIDSQNIGGSACDFYIVRIRANSITLMVPVKNASNVGLRTLVSTKEAEHIWEALRNNPQQTVHTGQNWNRRFREYSERLKSPDLSIVANVLRELLLIGRTKDLSFGERRTGRSPQDGTAGLAVRAHLPLFPACQAACDYCALTIFYLPPATR